MARTSDHGARAAAKAEAEIEKRLKKVYSQAQKELQEKMDDFQKRFKVKDAKKRQKLARGEITLQEYKNWQQGQVFVGDIWRQKVEQATNVLLDANRQAMAIVNGERMGVFAENANFQSYEIERRAKMDLSFSLYDTDTVARLIKKQPELLPRKVVDGKKDKAWNTKKISNAVTQGIIQGESLPDIAARIARETSSANGEAMMRYARTAVTAAHNAGRIETLHRAKDMGINVRKKWLATLDSHTRDSHQKLDGQEQDVDEPFQSMYGEIMYPGDPDADPGDVYNCRCRLTYIYPDFSDLAEDNERLDNESRETIEYMTYSEWEEGKKQKAAGTDEIVTGSLQSRLKNGKIRELGDEVKPPAETAKAVEGFSRIGGKHTREQDCRATNPMFGEGEEWRQNCQRCCATYEARRRGFNVTALPLYGDPFADQYARNSGYYKFFQHGGRVSQNIYRTAGLSRDGLTTESVVDAIQGLMDGYGNGSRAIIEGYWNGTPLGHVFIAENVGGKVHFYDVQSGDMNYGERVLDMEARSMRIFRIDDLPFSEDIRQAVKNSD